MLNRNIRIGFIGCGWITEHAHIPAFISNEKVSICSAFDTEIKKASRLKEKFDIPNVYDDLNMFLNSGIDAVIIATPNNTHTEYSIKALEHGLHVMCEKPVAILSEDVKVIIDTAQKKNRLFIPGFVNRFRNDIKKIREYIESKKIGDVAGIDAGWFRRSGIPRPGTWFTNKFYSGGGVLIDLGSHVIDICLMILRDKLPLYVSLSSSNQNIKTASMNAEWFNGNYVPMLPIDVEDTAIGKIEFEENIFLNIALSWAADIEGDCTFITVYGSKGSIKLQTLFGFSNDRLRDEDSLVIMEGSNTINVLLDKEMNNTRNAFSEMAKYFVNAIYENDISFLSGIDALKTVSLIERLYKNEKQQNRIEKYVWRDLLSE